MRFTSRARALAVGISAVLVAGLLSVASPALAAGSGSGSVSGTVTFPAGLDAIDGSTAVNLYTADGTDPVASDDVEPDGTYRVIGLQPGTYRLQVTSDIPAIADEWWQSAVDYADATDIVVLGTDVPGVDITLDRGATVSGTVDGGYVAYGEAVAVAYRKDRVRGWVAESSGPITADGLYTIPGLRAGTYTLSFTDVGWQEFDEDGTEYSQWKEWWNDQPGTGTASEFDVSAVDTLTGYDADLDTVGDAYSWPTISGVAQVGQTLTAAAGVWAPGTALEYQWYADDELISGAVGTKLVLTPAHRGLRIVVAVWGRTGPTTWEVKDSDPTDEVSTNVLTAATPTISGSLAYGSIVTAKPGAWTAGATLSYQWYANGRAISGATAASFKLGTEQKGVTLAVKVTGKKTGFITASRTSTTTAKVATAGTPTVTGRASVGSTLTAKPGTWTSGTTFSYRWYADGVAITDATRSTFTITKSQMGKAITVKVAGRKSGYATVAKASAATPRVPRVGTPTIAGRTYQTLTLTANAGTWSSGTSFSYQWYADGRALTNATKSTLTLSNGHIGKRITVKVTGRKSGYTTISKISAATAVVKSGTSRPASKDNCPSAYPVKGNQTTRHTTDWIYHVPGGRYYAVTDPEQCFVTPRAAELAGYRASRE